MRVLEKRIDPKY